jgi:hypothetical protein
MLIWSGVMAMTRIIIACFLIRWNMQYGRIKFLAPFAPQGSMPGHLESCYYLWRFAAACRILLAYRIGWVLHN